MNYLKLDRVLFIHEQVIEGFGGSKEHYHDTIDKIRGILAQQHPVFGFDKYPSPYQKAAMLLYFFAKDHCFVDGNKRVAITCAGFFLLLNGYADHLDDQEGTDKTLEVTCSSLEGRERDEYINQLADWLARWFY